MTWFLSGRRARQVERAERERQLVAAESEVERIGERAERVAGPLRQRLARNYWSESVAAIARREV